MSVDILTWDSPSSSLTSAVASVFFYTNTHPPDVNTKLYVGMGGLRPLDESSEHPADEDVSIFTPFLPQSQTHVISSIGLKMQQLQKKKTDFTVKSLVVPDLWMNRKLSGPRAPFLHPLGERRGHIRQQIVWNLRLNPKTCRRLPPCS